MGDSTGAAGTGHSADGFGDGFGEVERPASGGTVRSARRADLEPVGALDQEVFPGFSYPLFVLRQYLDAQPQSIFLVIEDGGVVCGYALATVVLEERKAWLQALAVSEQYRGRRYGDTLLNALLMKCRESGVERVLITVRPNNEAALGLYTKYDFHKTDYEDNYYGDLEPREIMQSLLISTLRRPRPGR
jgi:ribosomal-protein-alanine N-acetyltransferase